MKPPNARFTSQVRHVLRAEGRRGEARGPRAQQRPEVRLRQVLEALLAQRQREEAREQVQEVEAADAAGVARSSGGGRRILRPNFKKKILNPCPSMNTVCRIETSGNFCGFCHS